MAGAPLARVHQVHVHPSILGCTHPETILSIWCTRPENNPLYMVHPSCRLPKGAPEYDSAFFPFAFIFLLILGLLKVYPG